MASAAICDFCGKTQREVLCLVQGKQSSICNECIQLCLGLLEKHLCDRLGVATPDSTSVQKCECPPITVKISIGPDTRAGLGPKAVALIYRDVLNIVPTL